MRVFNIIKQASLVVTAGLIFTACASMDEENAEYSSSYTTGSTIPESSGSQSSYSSQTQTSTSGSSQNFQASQANSSSGKDEVIIQLHEEQFNVGKRTVPAGQVTIRKIVTTETVNQPVQLRRERVVIEREGAGAASTQASGSSYSSSASSQSASSSESLSASGTSASAGVSASAEAPSAEISSTRVTTSEGADREHRKGGTVGAQLNQRAADRNKTVLGTEPVGSKADYNAITGIPRVAPSSDATLPSTSVTVEHDRYSSAPAGSQISEAAGAERTSAQSPTYSGTASSQNQRSSATTSSQSQKFSGSSTSSQSAPAGAFEEQTYTIQLSEEEAVVQKNVVQSGRVVARKNSDTRQENVSQQIRREDVQIDKGDAQNVELKGDFSEAASSKHSGKMKKQQSSESQKKDNSTRGGAEDLQQPE